MRTQRSLQGVQVSASRRSGTTDELGPDEPERAGPTDEDTEDIEGTVNTEDTESTEGSMDAGGSDLLAALLDGMDAALCAFDADGVVTHWNREAERILGWTAAEAVGRRGFAGWAVRTADAEEVEGRLMAAMHAAGRQVHEFALVTKDGGRVLVRTQSAAVRGPDGKPAGLYCAFSEVHAQIDLERSIALSEALFEDASWGVVLVDADLRPAVVNAHAARALGIGRTAVLGRPSANCSPRASRNWRARSPTSSPRAPRPRPPRSGSACAPPRARSAAAGAAASSAWPHRWPRSRFPSASAGSSRTSPSPSKSSRRPAQLRFRVNQLHRAARAAAECEDPGEAATVHLDFALAGFADHALIDRVAGGSLSDGDGPARLVRAASTPSGQPGPSHLAGHAGIPVRYGPGHPALQCAERAGSVRASAGTAPPEAARVWATGRQWPPDTVHSLCTVLRSRGRTLGVVTFLRGANRTPFERADTIYAEDIAVRIATALDLEALERSAE